VVSIYLSYGFKFGVTLQNPALQEGIILKTIILFSLVKYVNFFRVKLYQFTWSYVGINDLSNLLKASTISLVVLSGCYILGRHNILLGLPKSVIVADYFISFILAGFLRISKRLYYEIFNPGRGRRGKNTLIIGAGSEGEMILRDLQKNNFINYYPLGFLDKEIQKTGFYIHNIPVVGDLSSLERMVKQFEIEALIISDHTLSLKEIQDIFTRAKKVNVNEIKVIPRLYSVTEAEISVKKLEDIRIEELINRQEIQVDVNKISGFLKNKRILVTGAAGSIGSEIIRQIALFEPSQIVLFEIDETEVFYLERELSGRFPGMTGKIESVIGDVRDQDRVRRTFENYRPDIVFHAAAYKHVPLMETNPEEAVKVNIFGTYNLCVCAIESKTAKFINISTDKAVKPVSVMGITKRYCEYITQTFNDVNRTQFISVRFGNVLGSRGSVLPVFLEQLRHGGPLTITHKGMKRYFMTIPESVTLVLQAALIGKGGEVMVLDMGEPVYIQKLAEELIKLHGVNPYSDIDIEYIGTRPGEKIFEEILTAEEGTTKTNHERIFIANISKHFSLEEINKNQIELENLLKSKFKNNELKNMILGFVNKSPLN
jgi:FlaA1/EpsC-like NDP-sugar epimerase